MKNRFFKFVVPVVLILSWVFFPGCGQIERQSMEKKEIEALFEKYRNALLDFYGEEAVKLVCSQTIEWYDQIVDDALYLEAAALKQADIMKKFTVLRVRLEKERTVPASVRMLPIIFPYLSLLVPLTYAGEFPCPLKLKKQILSPHKQIYLNCLYAAKFA